MDGPGIESFGFRRRG